MTFQTDFLKQDPKNVSPLNLAFIGDSVYELAIRNKVLAEYNGSLKDVNARAGEYTCATAQSRMILALEEELTEEELRIYKRGRNAKSVSAPKSCTISQYRQATGFEALLGYLFLAGRYDRLLALVDKAVESEKEKKNGTE